MCVRTKVPTHTQIKGSNYDARTMRPTHTSNETTTDDVSNYDTGTIDNTHQNRLNIRFNCVGRTCMNTHISNPLHLLRASPSVPPMDPTL